MLSELKHIILFNHHRPVELFSGVTAMLWGFWLLSPHWFLFGIPVYSAFQATGGRGWGVVAFALGIIQIVCALRYRRRMRRYSAFAMITFWIFVATAFVISDFRTTATIVYPMITLLNIWAFIRLGCYNLPEIGET